MPSCGDGVGEVTALLWAARQFPRTPSIIAFESTLSRRRVCVSVLARLNYVHQNPVKHGLVLVANQYPWCSARWFEREASPAMVKSIYRFKTDQLQIPDEFEP